MNTHSGVRMMASGRSWLLLSGTLAAVLMLALPDRPAQAEGETVQVYRTPSCGCCGMWADHLRASGYDVVVQDVDDLAGFKQMAGVPDHLQACHTATVEGYLIEGHVPAVAIDRLLEQRPDVRGLAVPGMPAGSPGMPSATPDRYHVLTFGDGSEDVFATFVGPDEE